MGVTGVLILALFLDALVGTAVSTVGASRLRWIQAGVVASYAMICSRLVNDVQKAASIQEPWARH
jgi:hypothetical protein